MRRRAAYWLGRLATLPAAPELPLAGSRRLPRFNWFTQRAHRLPPEQWGALVKAGRGRAG